MNRKLIFATLLLLLLTSVLLRLNRVAAHQPPGVPLTGEFLVTLNGFTVLNETSDDMLERDGKRDEVFVVAEVWVKNKQDEVTYRRSLRSKVMGDTNGFPDRVKAGSASNLGGLRTGDRFPSNEPWRRTGNPWVDRVPMFLWAGRLTQGENVAIIHPTIWEWDDNNHDVGSYESMWTYEMENNPNSPFSLLAGLSLKSDRPWGVVHAASDGTLGYGLRRGNYPIGLRRGVRPEEILRPRIMLTLTYETAMQAIQTSNTDKGKGIFMIDYDDSSDLGLNGRYILYLQVERAK